MEIKPLEGMTPSSILRVFNESFSDYSIPFQYTDEGFTNKIMCENINLHYSPGAFIDGELVGFILHGLDEIDGHRRVFNAGTGVVPKHRGKRIVEQLYNYMLPILAEGGYVEHQLEVLEGNDKAERAYQKVGFIRRRKVTSFTGAVGQIESRVKVEEIKSLDWNLVQTFWNVTPTWQNNIQCILRNIDKHRIFITKVDNEIAGYAITDKSNGRLRQFAVQQEQRRKGIGSALFRHAADENGKVSFTNFDESDTESMSFFRNLGLEPTVVLHEMTLNYTN